MYMTSSDTLVGLIATLYACWQVVISYRTKDGPFDDLVLADFGLSREIMPGELIQGVAGSPGYWSVEMCQGKGYTILADEWALG